MFLVGDLKGFKQGQETRQELRLCFLTVCTTCLPRRIWVLQEMRHPTSHRKHAGCHRVVKKDK